MKKLQAEVTDKVPFLRYGLFFPAACLLKFTCRTYGTGSFLTGLSAAGLHHSSLPSKWHILSGGSIRSPWALSLFCFR
jgi:hypothetical protein